MMIAALIDTPIDPNHSDQGLDAEGVAKNSECEEAQSERARAYYQRDGG